MRRPPHGAARLECHGGRPWFRRPLSARDRIEKTEGPLSIQLAVDPLVLLAGALLVAGVLAAGFADRVRVPALLLFLTLGMLVGDDGLDLVSFSDAALAQGFGVVALVMILYEGGLTTKLSDLREAALPGLAMATLGVLLTAAIVAGAVLLVTGADAVTAWLLGAIVSSTDAAAVFGQLRQAGLPRKVTALLEVESGLNDPMAILLTIGVLEAWRADPDPGAWLAFGVVQLGGGLLIGAALGLAGSWALQRVQLGGAGHYPVLALAVAGVTYGAAASVGGSGFLAVYVAGLLVAARTSSHRRRAILAFHDALANTAEIGLFLLLGLLVFPADLPAVAPEGLAVTAVLILLARPVAVLATLAAWLPGASWNARELVLVSWAGLRGAVPIVLATFPLTAGFPGGAELFNTVFFVVLVSAALQGSTVAGLAARLGLREPAGDDATRNR